MTAIVLRLVGVGLLALLALTLLALLAGHGDAPSQALAAYDRYLPGNRLPADLRCNPITDYTMIYGLMCSIDAAPHCQRGYVIARDGVITYLRLVGCDFPVAYLIAQRGRFQRLSRYRRIVTLTWEGMSAQVQRTGRFHTMQQVSSVGWWIPSSHVR